MHQHRRRKKRPSYGVRTVEVSRGKNGFGFTISGQAPCILSCIISASPAEKAGLRPGDFLIAVNSQNVSKAPHDDVVRLIGNSSGVLKLQIAENYYSDSSEEEFVSVVKLRPKYPNKIKNKKEISVSRAEKVVRDLQSGALFVDHIHGNKVASMPHKQNARMQSNNVAGPSRTNKVLLDLILQQRLQDIKNKQMPIDSFVRKNPAISTVSSDKVKPIKKKDHSVTKSQSHPDNLNVSSSSSEIFHSIFTEKDLNNILYPALFASQYLEEKDNHEEAIIKSVVGYLGTVEMPKESQVPNSRLSTIRNCIRRLRIEKKVHTLCLLSVFSERIILVNPQGVTLAEFPADNITFSGACSNDSKFFGLVTHGRRNDVRDNNEILSISSSCHVFMVDPKLSPHNDHLKRAKAFHITCSFDPVTKKCKEFPESADVILQAIVGIYKNRIGSKNNEIGQGLEFHINISPEPSHTSSNNSSNSDSGIGFQNEGNASDRVHVGDVDNYFHECGSYIHTNSLNRQVYSNPTGFRFHDSTYRSISATPNICPMHSFISNTHVQSNESKGKKCKNPCRFDRLTVRAMPDLSPLGFGEHCSNYNENLDESINNNIFNHRIGNSVNQNENSILNVFNSNLYNLIPEENISHVECHTHKLSPKVYSVNFQLKSEDEMGLSTDSVGCECTSCSTENLKANLNNHHMFLHYTNDTGEEIRDEYVNLSTEKNEDSEYEIAGVHGIDASRKCSRTSSLRRHLVRKRSTHRGTQHDGTVSDGEIASCKISSSHTSSMLALDLTGSDISNHSSSASDRPIDVGRVGRWATGFKILLEDPAGLYAFRQFLKLEFAEENITFYLACEKYCNLKNENELKQLAKEIYSKHLSIGAHEPVNIDCQARSIAQGGLDSATPDLFLPAQKQIFNLMKFDSYPRFLKSSLFKECMLREMEKCEPLLFDKGDSNCSDVESEKDKVNQDFKKRKSLIPWHRLSKTKGSHDSKSTSSKFSIKNTDIRKSLKKKKDKEDKSEREDNISIHSERDLTDQSSITSSEPGTGMMCILKNISSLSRESLNSAELTLFPSQCGSDGVYCRVILPDRSTTVVRTEAGETVGEMLLKLLEKRSLSYNAVEAYVVGFEEPLDHSTDVASLSCKEIKVEHVVLFCVELPNRKTVGVKAKNNKICKDILKPVLCKYGYSIDSVIMTVASSKKPVPKNASITVIDNEKIIVEERDKKCYIFFNDSNSDKERHGNDLRLTPSPFPDLEELTNQIFEDLLKTRPEFQFEGLITNNSDGKKIKKNSFSKSSNFFRKGSTKHDTDTLKNRNSKKHYCNVEAEHKPLLPHNPTRLKNVYDIEDYSHSNSGKDHYLFDSNIKEISHGKENCPLSKSDIKASLPLTSNIEVNYGLASALQNIDTGFTQDMEYSQESETYFSRACYSPKHLEGTSSEKFLQNLGIIPSNVLVSSRNNHWGSQSHSSSHLPPRVPPRSRISEHKDSNLLSPNPSPTPNLDTTLIGNESFELDLDVDVTLHAQSDDSLSPHSSFPTEPSSSKLTEQSNEKDVPKEQDSLQHLSHEPPPVPPKASLRGPPPRPPSRQHSHVNSAFCLTSDDGISDDDDGLEVKSKHDIIIQSMSYSDVRKDCGEYNISFV